MPKAGGPSRNFMVKVWCPQMQVEAWGNANKTGDVNCVKCGKPHPAKRYDDSYTIKVEVETKKSKSTFKKGKNQKKSKSKKKEGGEAKV